MKKKSGTYKDYEKYITRIIDKYIPILLLERHTFEIERGVSKSTAHFQCKCNYPYLNATICYSEQSFKDWNSGIDQIPYIVHEMCHLITDPFYCKANQRYVSENEILDERENLTDLICNIVIKNEY